MDAFEDESDNAVIFGKQTQRTRSVSGKPSEDGGTRRIKHILCIKFEFPL